MKTRTARFDGLPLLMMKLQKYSWTNTEQTLQIKTINNLSLKHNQITRIQTQKHSFKINQIITIKAKKKKKKDKGQKPADPSGLGWGRRWATTRRWELLECSWMREERKIFLSQREFWNQVKKKKRERELEKERAPGTFWWMRENEEEKESKRGVEIVDNVWRRKKRNKTYGWKWNGKRKNNIKNKKF